MNYAAIYAAMYTLVAEDSATRALLGANGFMADRGQLANLNGRVLPWLVWTYGPVSGASDTMGNVYANWWAYGALDNARPLYRIAAAIEAVYSSERGLAIDGGRLFVGPLGQPSPDAAIGSVQSLQIPVYFRALR